MSHEEVEEDEGAVRLEFAGENALESLPVGEQLKAFDLVVAWSRPGRAGREEEVVDCERASELASAVESVECEDTPY